MQFGGDWFQTQPLSGPQWAMCVCAGALTLLVRLALRLVDTTDPADRKQVQAGGPKGGPLSFRL